MATLRQIEANRRNAQLSTGPRSVEGKAVSRLNALKSGIDAKLHLIKDEDPATLEALTAEYYDRWRPTTPEVRALVDSLISNEWLLRRRSPNMPGGTYSLQVTGSIPSLRQHIAAFSLSTQVTTFQVAGSPTGGAIVHNDGQQVNVVHTVPAGNAPTITTCDTGDPNVTCSVVSTAPGSVTLGITASRSAVHGARLLRLNGAMSADGSVVDELPSLSSAQPGDIPAGTESTITLEGSGLEGGSCSSCSPVVLVFDEFDNPVSWASGGVLSDTTAEINANPPVDATGSTYYADVNVCGWALGYYDSGDGGDIECNSGPVSFYVQAAQQPPTYVVGLQPLQLNLSTGDTNKAVTVTLTPNTVSYAPILSSSLTGNLNSSCAAGLTFGAANGTGSVSVPVTAAPAGCSGLFGAYATAGGATSNSIGIVVPPQILVQMLYGEAHSQAMIGDSTSQLAIGVATRNRFSQPSYFGGVTTYQAAITSSQFQGISGIAYGPSPDLDNAAAVFAGTDGTSVANAACFFSPTGQGWSAISAALQSGTLTLPTVAFDPLCYQANRQFVVKQSVGNNANGSGAPAFVFEQLRDPSSDYAVIQIQ